MMKKIDEIPSNTGDPGGKIEKKIKVMQDEDSRKANIIAYNAAESEEDDMKQRAKDDISFIQDMCENMQVNGFTDGNIMQVIRLGKREEGKTRPLLVKT